MILGKLNIPVITGGGSTLKNSLISCWEFEETSGTNLVDANGNYNFTANGATINQDAGKLGKSVYLGGVNAYLNLQTVNVGLVSTDTISVSHWVNPIGSTDYGFLINDYDRYSYRGLFTAISTPLNGNIYFFANNTTSPSIMRYRRTSYYTGAAWHHVVSIIYPDNRLPDMYVDGALDNANFFAPGTTSGLNITGYNVVFGREAYRVTPTGWYKGYVSQAAIWKRALTTAEIALLYNSGNGLTYTNW